MKITIKQLKTFIKECVEEALGAMPPPIPPQAQLSPQQQNEKKAKLLKDLIEIYVRLGVRQPIPSTTPLETLQVKWNELQKLVQNVKIN
jgi:hypothetical protein